MYAPGSCLAKESLFGTWCRISRAKQEDPLPLTPAKIRENVAILRSAGYKAAKSYVYEARDRHLRAGHEWNPQLQVAVQDAKRVAERAAGPTIRSEEVRSYVWEDLLERHGSCAVGNDASLRAPNGGALVWVVGAAFVLREVELASLTLDCGCLELNDSALTVTLKLPVSKSDASGRGAARTLGCSCKGSRHWLCPFHAVKELAELQCELLGIEDRGMVAPGVVPLVGTVEDSASFVEKDQLVMEAQRQVGIYLNEHPNEAIAVERITGHFMRRSGIKEMARKGCTFNSIQWFARHSSQVTWQYIEESWGENAEHSLKLRDEMQLTECVSSVLGKVNRLEEAVSLQEDRIEQSLQQDGFVLDMELLKPEIRKEARKALLPKFVSNVVSRITHRPSPLVNPLSDPKTWHTGCGWPWVLSEGVCRLDYEEDEVDPTYKKCLKCFVG